MLKVMWTKNFLEVQNCKMKLNTIFQDNESTIELIKIIKRVLVNALITLALDYFMQIALLVTITQQYCLTKKNCRLCIDAAY